MYKTSSYLRSSACGRPGCWPGELGARERDRRSAGRAAGSEAIIMRACPAGRLARAIGKGERTPERRQNAARAHPAQAPRTQPDGSQNASDAWKLLKTIVIFERCGFAAKKMFRKHAKLYAAAAPRRRRRAPRSGTCFVYVGAGWRFFEKGGFLVSSICAQHFLSLFPAHFGNEAKQRKA